MKSRRAPGFATFRFAERAFGDATRSALPACLRALTHSARDNRGPVFMLRP